MVQIPYGPRVAVVGAGSCDGPLYALARELGRLLANAGCVVVCGGLGGVMEAVSRGAAQAGGLTVGILPGTETADANEFIQVPVATGLGHMRNYLVVLNARVVVAVGGGYGTLSEIALAKKIGRPVIVLEASGGWEALPGVERAQDPAAAVALAKKYLG